MRRPLVFVPPHLPLSIHPDRFAAFLRAYSLPLPEAALLGPRLDLARTLWGLACSEAFAEAIDLLDLLASPTGARAIADATEAARRKLPTGLAPADLAAVLLTLRARAKALERVLERAMCRFARIVPASLPFELVAREERTAGDPAACVPALKRVLSKGRPSRASRTLAVARDRFVAAWYAEDERGAIHIAVLRRDEVRADVLVGPKGARRSVRRTHAVDVLRVDVAEGRLVVRTEDPDLVRAYADAIGLALFHDARFFTDSPAYSLKAIVALGSAQLAAARPPGITRVRLVDLTWDDGEGTTYNAHGSDALAAFERRGGTTGGYVTGGMFRLDAAGVKRPVDVAVRLPHRAAYRGARHELLGRAALAWLGALAPGRIADDSYTLAPWTHAAWRWRRVLGDGAFERARTQKLLVRATTRMVGSPEMGKYGWSYVSFDLKSEPGKKYAVAMDPALRSRDLEPDELEMWRLDLDAVKRAFVAELATEPQEPDAAIEGRALDLGLVRGRGLDLRIFALLRSPGPYAKELAEQMLRAAGTAHVVVLLPEGKTLGCGVEVPLGVAELFGLGGVATRIFERVKEKKGLAHDVVDAWRLAGKDARFVAEEKTGRMWLDGQELTLREAGARLLLGTAKGAGLPVRTKELALFIAPNRLDDGVVRQTVPKLGGWVRECFAAAGKTPPADADMIVELVANKGWRMTVKCAVR